MDVGILLYMWHVILWVITVIDRLTQLVIRRRRPFSGKHDAWILMLPLVCFALYTYFFWVASTILKLVAL